MFVLIVSQAEFSPSEHVISGRTTAFARTFRQADWHIDGYGRIRVQRAGKVREVLENLR
jgi:hypothetical protein